MKCSCMVVWPDLLVHDVAVKSVTTADSAQDFCWEMIAMFISKKYLIYFYSISLLHKFDVQK